MKPHRFACLRWAFFFRPAARPQTASAPAASPPTANPVAASLPVAGLLPASLLVFLCMGSVLNPWLQGAAGHELTGYAEGEARLFFQEPVFPGQRSQSFSLAVQPEYYHEFQDGSSFTFTPFLRLDSQDSARTHFDIRELTYLYLHPVFELRLGVRRVFWGVTEFLHLIDIINQTDLVENLDTEDKLGQPMVNVSISRDWGVLDLFWMPYFRERTFPGTGGRLRFPTVLDTDRVVYASGAGQWHQDVAVRYGLVAGDWDLGLSWFHGTSREPTFLLTSTPSGPPLGRLLYQQIDQLSADVSYVTGAWLWKLEALQRWGQGNLRTLREDAYAAFTSGFEYTLFGWQDTPMDLGLIAEYMFDERRDNALTAFANDLALGARLAFNDAASTEVLVGIIQDLDTASRFVSVEASRRLGERWTLDVEVRLFLSQPTADFFSSFADDDLVQLDLQYHF